MVSPVSVDGLIAPFSKIPRAQRSFCRKLLKLGLQWISILIEFMPSIWQLQEKLLWIQSQWILTFLCMQCYTQQQRRLMTILQVYHLPFQLTWEFWNQSSVVYMRLHMTNGQFYIGSTQLNVFGREQTRLRKFRQLLNDQLGYFEPALKLWRRLGNFFEFGIFPLFTCSTDQLLCQETAVQKTTAPLWNWPQIIPMLKRYGVGKQQFSFQRCLPVHSKTSHKWMKRYRQKTAHQGRCEIAQRFSNYKQIFHFLYMLGSDTRLKFDCSRVLRSNLSDTPFVFLLWRMTNTLSEPWKTRARSQLKSILTFRHTEPPPANQPLRLRLIHDGMLRDFRRWLLGFTFFHQHSFPPLHKVRAPIVVVKGHTLQQLCFDFRHRLKFWHPDHVPDCQCTKFPAHVQQRQRPTTHISCFASDFGSDSLFEAHMSDEVLPTFEEFLHHNTLQFERFLSRWKLPRHLMQYWQHFLSENWDKHSADTTTTWTSQHVRQRLRSFSAFVLSPADHFPNSICVHCPCQWHYLLMRTFDDPKVFVRCRQTSMIVLNNIRDSIPDWISKQYRWGFDFVSSGLSKGYILPKPSREFAKARPIVNYSQAWPRKLGSVLSTILLEILKVVYCDILEFADVHAVLHAIQQLFQTSTFVDCDYDLYQSDIAGFYNQVQHSRILRSIEYAVYTFANNQTLGLDTMMQGHISKHERQLRVFQGRYRGRTKDYRSIRLGDIPPLVDFLLSNSFFSVGLQVFRQIRGASMGSQWAPILCSAVALQREQLFHQFNRPLVSLPSVHHRYVDNRILLIPKHQFPLPSVQFFWHLSFYQAPILLEVVDGYEALGYTVDPLQATITMVQPWNKSLRSQQSSSIKQAMISGIQARIRLIVDNVFPSTLHIAQIQDLLGLVALRNPHFFDCEMKQLMVRFLRQLRVHFDRSSVSLDPFCWV